MTVTARAAPLRRAVGGGNGGGPMGRSDHVAAQRSPGTAHVNYVRPDVAELGPLSKSYPDRMARAHAVARGRQWREAECREPCSSRAGRGVLSDALGGPKSHALVEGVVRCVVAAVTFCRDAVNVIQLLRQQPREQLLQNRQIASVRCLECCVVGIFINCN